MSLLPMKSGTAGFSLSNGFAFVLFIQAATIVSVCFLVQIWVSFSFLRFLAIGAGRLGGERPLRRLGSRSNGRPRSTRAIAPASFSSCAVAALSSL